MTQTPSLFLFGSMTPEGKDRSEAHMNACMVQPARSEKNKGSPRRFRSQIYLTTVLTAKKPPAIKRSMHLTPSQLKGPGGVEEGKKKKEASDNDIHAWEDIDPFYCTQS